MGIRRWPPAASATGLIGRALVLRLQRDGHQVTAWVRGAARARTALGSSVRLVPGAPNPSVELDAAIGTAEAVINLAGEPIVAANTNHAAALAAPDTARQSPRGDMTASIGTSFTRGREAIGAPPRSALATRVLQRSIDKQLAGLTGGRLTLVDHEGRAWHYGTPGELHAHVNVVSPRFFRAVALGGNVGGARSYMRGEWDSDDLVSVFRLFARDRASSDRLEGGLATAQRYAARVSHWLRRNTPAGSRRNIEAHYDLGNALFETFLDPTMTYSSAIFACPEDTLEQAQLTKIDRLCDKLRLNADDHLLEIGTGWGGLAIRAAQRHGCRVTTTTLSREQAAMARARIAAAHLADRVEVVERDYRRLTGQYDKIVSVEMIEAVGHQSLGDYFAACAKLLRDDGIMALQAITVRDQRYALARTQVDVIQALLFPGADIPSVTAMLDACTAASDLNMVHLEDITPHYAETTRRWRQQFHANIDRVRALGSTEQFIRLWHYYLCYCEAGFVERYTGCVQLLLAKPGARPRPILGAIGDGS